MPVRTPRKASYFLLEGHNDPGFSGGPVIYSPPEQPTDVRVGAVISGYGYDWDTGFVPDPATQFAERRNKDVIVAYSIDYAVELIMANPIGADVDAD